MGSDLMKSKSRAAETSPRKIEKAEMGCVKILWYGWYSYSTKLFSIGFFLYLINFFTVNIL